MPQSGFGKDQWVALFREIGLDEPAMQHWHAAFERRWPEAHGSFLEWLRLPDADIERIRKASREAWAGSRTRSGRGKAE